MSEEPKLSEKDKEILGSVLFESENCARYAENFNTKANAYLDGVRMGVVTVLRTHATNDANLVPLDKVVEILKSTEVSGFPYHLVPFSESIDRLITQIKNLTKE